MGTNQLWRKAYSRERANSYAKLIRLGLGPFYKTTLDVVCDTMRMLLRPGKILRILDLGAGTGNVSKRILSEFPDVSILCLDGSREMLAQAKRRLAGKRQITFSERDFSKTGWVSDLGKFDVVLSVGAIHHLDAGGKAALFRQIYGILIPDGLVVCGDPVKGSTPTLDNLNENFWMYHFQKNIKKAEKRLVPIDELRIQFYKLRDEEGDQPSSLEEQFIWLRDAGFRYIDCFWKHFPFAVFGGIKS